MGGLKKLTLQPHEKEASRGNTGKLWQEGKGGGREQVLTHTLRCCHIIIIIDWTAGTAFWVTAMVYRIPTSHNHSLPPRHPQSPLDRAQILQVSRISTPPLLLHRHSSPPTLSAPHSPKKSLSFPLYPHRTICDPQKKRTSTPNLTFSVLLFLPLWNSPTGYVHKYTETYRLACVKSCKEKKQKTHLHMKHGSSVFPALVRNQYLIIFDFCSVVILNSCHSL